MFDKSALKKLKSPALFDPLKNGNKENHSVS